MSNRNAIAFDEAVAVIAGAGPGLGATLARRFAAAGASVAVIARSSRSVGAAMRSATDAGADVVGIEADVTSVGDMRAAAEVVVERFGRVDALVNMAFAAMPRREVIDLDDEDLERWRATVETGGFGTLLSCRFFSPSMVAAGGGSIVNITSMSSRVGFAGRSEYAAGKAQSHRIAHALADELGPKGVRVNCVAPGPISSNALSAFYRSRADTLGITYDDVLQSVTDETALRRIVTADEVANAVLFLSSELASGITGAVIDVNAGQLSAP